MESLSLAVEQLSPGVKLERLHNDQIFVFTITDVSRATIDTWANTIKDLTAGWPDEHRYYALNHFAGKDVSLTPYLRAKITELTGWRPEQGGYIAAVLPRTFFAQLMTLFLPTMNRRNMQNRLFFTREEGLAWVEKMMAKDLGE